MQGRVDDMVSKYIEFYSERNKWFQSANNIPSYEHYLISSFMSSTIFWPTHPKTSTAVHRSAHISTKSLPNVPFLFPGILYSKTRQLPVKRYLPFRSLRFRCLLVDSVSLFSSTTPGDLLWAVLSFCRLQNPEDSQPSELVWLLPCGLGASQEAFPREAISQGSPKPPDPQVLLQKPTLLPSVFFPL